jgi:CheY-like chemotaxis protein
MLLSEGPILFLEHDRDDQEQLKEVFKNLQVPNELKIFEDCAAALEYLRHTKEQPFLILSDVRFPGMDAFMLREEIIKDEYLRKKAIPYVFLSDYADPSSINRAYELEVQGFFEKENSLHHFQQVMKNILEYWKKCKHPNSF